MKKIPYLSAIVLATLNIKAQEIIIPANLTSAVKEGLQKLEEKKQEDIIFYSKNNAPDQDTVAAASPQGDFYELYRNDPDNRYYNTYHGNAIDPVLTNMPAPGPNLNYWLIDPCSSGNYDKVVPEK